MNATVTMHATHLQKPSHAEQALGCGTDETRHDGPDFPVVFLVVIVGLTVII